MGDVTYVPDESGLRAMAVGPELLASCVAVAEKGEAFAIAIAPRDTNEYAESFDVQPGVVTIGSLPRAGAKLVNEADHAAAVEWGNEQSPNGQHVLGRTADALERLR